MKIIYISIIDGGILLIILPNVIEHEKIFK